MSTFRYGLLLLIATLLFPAASWAQGTFDPVAAAEEAERLAGKWKAIEGLRAGKAIPKEELANVRFAMSFLKLQPFGEVFLTHYPKHRQFSFSNSVGAGGGKVYRGFYEVDGDKLRVCVATFNQTNFYPALAATYEEAAQGPYILLTFARAKP